MPTNFYFNTLGHYGEQNLIEDLIIESIKIYGIECYYLPKTLVNIDNLFGEDTLSKYEHAYPIEMYVKSVNGFEGDGDFLSKFGLEVRDEMVLSIAQRRFGEEIPEQHTTGDTARPVEGDLIYFPLNGKLYEIKFVEHEVVFYQMGKLQTYDLTVELYEYSSERLDTGIAAIDDIEGEFSLDALQANIVLERYLPIAEALASVSSGIVQSIAITFGEDLTYGERPGVEIAEPTDGFHNANAYGFIYTSERILPVSRHSEYLNSVFQVLPILAGANTADHSDKNARTLIVANTGLGYPNTSYANAGVTITEPLSTPNGLQLSRGISIKDGVGLTDFYRYNANNTPFSSAASLSSYQVSLKNNEGYIETFIYANTLPTSGEYAGLFMTGGGTNDTNPFARNQRRIVALDSNGDLVEFRPESSNNDVIQLTSSSPISTDAWQHILYSVQNKELKIWVDGSLVKQEANGYFEGLITYRGYALGSNTIGTYTTTSNTTFTISNFNGYMQMFHVNTDMSDLPVTGDVATVPTVPYTSDANTVANWDLYDLQASVNVEANNQTISIKQVSVRDSGFGFATPPTITLRDYRQPITATATAIFNSDNTLQSLVVTNGGFGYLVPPTVTLSQTEADYENLLTEDGDKIINEAQTAESQDTQANNTLFSTEVSDFIDFNDQNPFSEGDSW